MVVTVGVVVVASDGVVVSADPGVTVTTTGVDSVDPPASARVDVVSLSVALLQLAATSINSEPRTKRRKAENFMVLISVGDVGQLSVSASSDRGLSPAVKRRMFRTLTSHLAFHSRP